MISACGVTDKGDRHDYRGNAFLVFQSKTIRDSGKGGTQKTEKKANFSRKQGKILTRKK